MRVYNALLLLYPRDYRSMFAAEMSTVFEEAAEDRRGRGWATYVQFILGELTDLAIGAGADWAAKLTTDRAVRGRCLPDWTMMRPPGVSHEDWWRVTRTP